MKKPGKTTKSEKLLLCGAFIAILVAIGLVKYAENDIYIQLSALIISVIGAIMALQSRKSTKKRFSDPNYNFSEPKLYLNVFLLIFLVLWILIFIFFFPLKIKKSETLLSIVFFLSFVGDLIGCFFYNSHMVKKTEKQINLDNKHSEQNTTE